MQNFDFFYKKKMCRNLELQLNEIEDKVRWLQWWNFEKKIAKVSKNEPLQTIGNG